jgi:hypothetical protein
VTRLWPEGEPVQVWSEKNELAGFIWQGAAHRIQEVCNCWRIHTRWWEPGEDVWREYQKVTTDTGLLCLLYQDLMGEGWFLARVYD